MPLPRISYSRSELLCLGGNSTNVLQRNVRRKLWFFGLLRKTSAQRGSADLDSPTQDSRPAQPEPRELAPPQPTPRTARNDTNNRGNGRSPLPSQLRLATFNARTLTQNWRLQELAQLTSSAGISVLAVQEHRRSREESVDLERGWTFKAARASPLGHGGIGFLLSPVATSALLNVTFVSDRLGLASFALKDRRLHVACAYAPTAPRTLQDPTATEEFYDRLGCLVDSLPARDCVFIAGDFNAPLPADGHHVKNSCGNANDNTSFLSTFIRARNLTAVNGFLRQRHRKLPTFYGPNGRITRLDWILCHSSLRSRLRRVSTTRPVCVRSDHSLVTCATDLRWPRKKRFPPTPLWSALSERDIRQAFLDRLRCNTNLRKSASSLSEAISAAASFLPTKQPDRPKSVCQSDPYIAQARRLVQSACALYGFDSSQAKAATDDLRDVHARRMETYIEEEVHNIQLATDNCRHTAAWSAINRLTGRRARPLNIIGANSVEHRKAQLVTHYSRVLNAPVPDVALLPVNDLQPADSNAFNTGPISIDEVVRALTPMRADSAAGIDGIPVRVLKLPELAPALTSVLNNHCCLGGDATASAAPPWRISMIVSIPKSGGSTNLDNQRGIALECSVPKLLNAVLRNRLLPVLDPILLGLQSGFRPGRCAVEQIAAIRSVIDSCRTRQRAAAIVFVDFRKAFHSVSRSSIPQLLAAYGVPSLLIEATMDLYKDSTAFVRTRDGPTASFPTSSGVLQGDTLAPLLFALVVDFILRRCLRDEDCYVLAGRRSSRNPAVSLSALAYADDIALLCRNPTAAQRALTRLCEEAARVGLEVNARKTKVLHVGFSNTPALLLPNGESISTCEDFSYLGSRLMNPDNIIAERKAQAWRAAFLLRSLFNSAAKDEWKIRLFRSAVEPILLYSLEAVPLTPSRERALDASYRRLLRYALGIHFPERLSSQRLKLRTGVPPISDTLRRRRQMLLGHCLRRLGRGEVNPLALTIVHLPTERLRRGHGRTVTLASTFLSDLKCIGLTPLSASTCPSALFRQRVRARLS